MNHMRYKNIGGFLRGSWSFLCIWCRDFCLLGFGVLNSDLRENQEQWKSKNELHTRACVHTNTIAQSINKYFLSRLPHSVSSTYASYSKIGQELRPPQRVHWSSLFIFLVPQESYLLANTVFCLSLHKHLEVINAIFHSQLVRATKHLWTSCSFAVIFPPRWSYTCSHQHSL